MNFLKLIVLVVLVLLTGCEIPQVVGYSSKSNIPTPSKTNESVSSNLNTLKIYKSGSIYEDVLVECVSDNSYHKDCSLNKLPIIAMETPEPTKDDILRRLLVSDKWMGDNFSEMLDYLPSDIKKLFGAVTAVVISRDIIPSYYNSATGAIYLDPRYFWFVPSEADTIIPSEDYRNEYGKSLQFIPTWRYIKDNNYASEYFPLDSGLSRTPEDVKYMLSRLLYHELAHANDFSSILEMASRDDSIAGAFEKYQQESLSAKLYNQYPLQDRDLKYIASVLFKGESSNSYLDSLTPEDVGLKFEDDGANDLYGFSNEFEDFAMLFEETMMRYHYGIERDVAFVSKEDPFIIGWGRRNRIADENVKVRAEFVVKSLLPDETNWDEFFSIDIGESKELKNVGWFDSLNVDGDIAKRLKTMSKTNRGNIMDFKSPEY